MRRGYKVGKVRVRGGSVDCFSTDGGRWKRIIDIICGEGRLFNGVEG